VAEKLTEHMFVVVEVATSELHVNQLFTTKEEAWKNATEKLGYLIPPKHKASMAEKVRYLERMMGIEVLSVLISL